jgi:hypothetical protein
MSNPLESLLGDSPEEIEEPSAQAEVETPSVEAAAPEVETPPAEPEAPPTPPLSEKETVGFYKAMQEERDRRQALEKQLARLKAQATPPAPPSRDEQLEAALYAQNLRASRKSADREYGRDVVQAVHDWAAAKCDADPAFNLAMRSSDDPYEAAMRAYNAEKVLDAVKPGDLDAFNAWKAEQSAAPAKANPETPASPPIPRSLANAPGNGAAGKAHVPVGPDEAFNSIFQG